MKEQAGIHSEVVGSVIDAVAATIHIDEEDMQVFTSGATNFFKYPELSDKEKASELISTFEEKSSLLGLARDGDSQGESTGIQIYIGEEVPVESMKDCSVVTASYELGGGMRGTIGIIGPKRMDFERVVRSFNKLKHELEDIARKK